MTRDAELAAPQVDSLPAHARLIAALASRLAVHGVPPRIVETHTSSVIVTADRAYKIKKPVALPFLDFSSLRAREHFCSEELRLNRRHAADLYLAVVPITGTIETPALHGLGPVLDYAVMMRAFPEDSLGSQALARGAFTLAHCDALADAVAGFHAGAPRAAANSRYGSPADVLRVALANCSEILSVPDAALPEQDVRSIAEWTRHEHAEVSARLLERQDAGYVRECHGDLHLGNIALIDGDPTLFDGIEFDANLRWIDVMSDVAFLVMDLHDRGRGDLAHRLLNAYLEHTGDYAGLSVLRFYLVYRAMVRAKIAAMRAHQLRGDAQHDTATQQARDYLALAQRFTRRSDPALLVAHGLAGSGKSTATQALLELVGAIRVRTDIERKRLRGLAPAAATDSPVGAGLYTEDATRRTYAATLARAGDVLDAGYVAIADGTFLRRWQRDLARRVARERSVPFAFLAVGASMTSLRQRILARRLSGVAVSEATLEVLERQIATADSLAADETSDVITYDSERRDPRDPLTWAEVLRRLGLPSIRRGRDGAHDEALAARVTFLRRPESYPEATQSVTAFETHWSWLFLTDRHVYKMKKPARTGFADLTTSEGRRLNAETELAVNRRLAGSVYEGLTPLYATPGGDLAFGGGSTLVDWLVRTRRLARDLALDASLRANRVSPDHVTATVERLHGFHREQSAVGMSGEHYLARLSHAIEESGRDLRSIDFDCPLPRIETLRQDLQRALLRLSPTLAQRAAHVVEGHGDLRPEHVFLESPPVVIDALEFSRELRLCDPADEIAFLALGCEQLDRRDIARAIIARYRVVATDWVPDAVLDWYMAFRGWNRARLAALHLAEHPVRLGDWRGQALAWLDLASEHVARCL